MQEGLYANLVVEKRNKDYDYINVSDLDILSKMMRRLDSAIAPSVLDHILSQFTEQEIKDSIKRANIVADVDIDDKRLLIKIGHHILPVLTKDITEQFDIYKYIRENFDNKTVKNVIFNKIFSIIKDEERIQTIKEIIDRETGEEFANSVNLFLTYIELRELYFYLYNYVAKTEEIRDNNHKRERVND